MPDYLTEFAEKGYSSPVVDTEATGLGGLMNTAMSRNSNSSSAFFASGASPMGGLDGEPKGSPVCSRSANPFSSAHHCLAADGRFSTVSENTSMTTITSANAPAVFNFQSNEVRTVTVDDQVWFVAADVCAALGVKNHREAIRHLDEDEKGVISNDTPGGRQGTSVVNESGLYALVLRSRKPEAKKFTKWVTSEVLPQIRKTGKYEPAPYSVNPTDKLTKEQADTLRDLLTSAVKRLPHEKQAGAAIQGWSKLKSHFGVAYREIPQSEFSEAVSLLSRHIAEWEVVEEFDAAAELQRYLASGRFFVTLVDGNITMRAVPRDAFVIPPEKFANVLREPGAVPREFLPAIISAAASRL